jgi:hypothetical protein
VKDIWDKAGESRKRKSEFYFDDWHSSFDICHMFDRTGCPMEHNILSSGKVEQNLETRAEVEYQVKLSQSELDDYDVGGVDTSRMFDKSSCPIGQDIQSRR